MEERDVVLLEVTYLREKVKLLREALLTEQKSKRVDLARWGSFSHDWNRDLRFWRQGKAACVIRSSRHRKAHKLAALLFPAWQQIHYSLTRPHRLEGWMIVLTTQLEAVERALEEFGGKGEVIRDETAVVPPG